MGKLVLECHIILDNTAARHDGVGNDIWSSKQITNHHQHTNTHLRTRQMPFPLINQQCQSI